MKYSITIKILGNDIQLQDRTLDQIQTFCKALDIPVPMLAHFSTTRGRLIEINQMHPNHCKHVIKDMFDELGSTAIKIKDKEYLDFVDSKLTNINTLLNQIQSYESTGISQKR